MPASGIRWDAGASSNLPSGEPLHTHWRKTSHHILDCTHQEKESSTKVVVAMGKVVLRGQTGMVTISYAPEDFF